MTPPGNQPTTSPKDQAVSANAVSMSTGLSVRPVTMTVETQARRRTDLPDIWTAELELGNGKMLRQHFREGSNGASLEDVTDLVAEILLDRSRSRKTAERQRQDAQVARVGLVTPERLRRDRGDTVVEGTMRAGRTRSRALTALGTIRQRDLLTTRQFEAGDRMAQDAKTMAGAREAKDEALAPDPTGGYAWEDFMIEAGRRLDLARTVCQSMAAFEGVSPWAMVEAVVLGDRTLTDAMGSHSASVLRRAKIALRIGLDAIGDAYKLPAAVTRTNVLLDGLPVPMTVTEDLDGKDRQEELQRLWRSIRLDDKPWVAVADSMPDLYELAKNHLKARR